MLQDLLIQSNSKMLKVIRRLYAMDLSVNEVWNILNENFLIQLRYLGYVVVFGFHLTLWLAVLKPCYRKTCFTSIVNTYLARKGEHTATYLSIVTHKVRYTLLD